MTEKIVVTKAGYDAEAEYDPDNMAFSSDYDTLKYHLSGSVDLTVSGSNAETNITHGLGYVPFFLVYVNYFANPTGTRYSMCPGTFVGPGIYTYANAYADNDKVYFRVETNSATVTYTFYYKVFRNNLNL